MRRYLGEFLADPRVVELPRWLWLPVLRGPVLWRRPAQSAAKYRKIWTDQGSPLMVHTRQQATLLRGWLGEAGLRVEVGWAMRYGRPGIGEVMRGWRERGLTRLFVLPLYPQYSASTTASVFDAVAAELATWRVQPALRTIRDFHARPDYIAALARPIADLWRAQGRPHRLLMSFHGLPQRSVDRGDPYERQCRATGTLLAEALGLDADAFEICFQSRFGRARWIGPATSDRLAAAAREGLTVDVVCPGFVADCLETLEEIAIEGRQLYEAGRGPGLRVLPCLNETPAFIASLGRMVAQELAGWPVRPPRPE